MISILVGYVIDGKSNGIDKYLVHMLELLKENGEEFKIQFLTNHTTQELEKIYGAYKADVIEEPSLKHPIKQCQFLKELIKNQRYDIAYFNISEAFNAMGILAAHKAGVKKIIVHAHSSKVDSAKLMARFFRWHSMRCFVRSLAGRQRIIVHAQSMPDTGCFQSEYERAVTIRSSTMQFMCPTMRTIHMYASR